MRSRFFLPVIACGLVAAACLPVPDPGTRMTAQAVQEAVSWPEALDLLRSGQVVMAAQTHDLAVTLTLKDGTRRITREPALDAIFVAIAQYAPNAGDIVRVTE